MNEIKLSTIAKIQSATIRIFEAEDCDREYIDRRTVAANERAIDRHLSKITDDKEVQHKVLEIINNNNFNTNDMTFKPICDGLRELGFVIKEGE